MADEDNVIFVRGSSNVTDNENDDVWDDSALIKAYDKAINLAKDEVAKQMGLNTTDLQSKSKSQISKQPQKKNKPHKKWTVGAPCRAVYSEDGELYEATVRKILGNTGTCIVEFIGYGNMEEVKLTSLLDSNGLQSQLAQKKQAVNEDLTKDAAACEYEQNAFASKSSKECNASVDDKMDFEPESMRGFKNNFMPGSCLPPTEMMPPAPPLPPQLMAKLPENDADALSSMLMSWYISGFHTGYYHGLKQAQSKQEKRKNC